MCTRTYVARNGVYRAIRGTNSIIPYNVERRLQHAICVCYYSPHCCKITVFYTLLATPSSLNDVNLLMKPDYPDFEEWCTCSCAVSTRPFFAVWQRGIKANMKYVPVHCNYQER